MSFTFVLVLATDGLVFPVVLAYPILFRGLYPVSLFTYITGQRSKHNRDFDCPGLEEDAVGGAK